MAWSTPRTYTTGELITASIGNTHWRDQFNAIITDGIPSLVVAQGTITTDLKGINLTATWNAAGVAFTAIKANVTNTASAAASLLLDLQVGGSSLFKVDKLGVVTLANVTHVFAGTLSGTITASGAWTFSAAIPAVIISGGATSLAAAGALIAASSQGASAANVFTAYAQNTGFNASVMAARSQRTSSSAFNLIDARHSTAADGTAGTTVFAVRGDGLLTATNIDVNVLTILDYASIENASPKLRWYDTDGTANNRRWQWAANTSIMRLDLLSDALGVQATPFSASAAGATVSVVELQQGVSTLNMSSNVISLSAGSGTQVVSSGLLVGAPTGGDKGIGTINVATDVYKNNTLYANPDYVLEQWATGSIVAFKNREGAADYTGLMSLLEVEQFARIHLHLPRIPRTTLGAFGRMDVVLEKIEELTLYGIDHEHRLRALEARAA